MGCLLNFWRIYFLISDARRDSERILFDENYQHMLGLNTSETHNTNIKS